MFRAHCASHRHSTLLQQGTGVPAGEPDYGHVFRALCTLSLLNGQRTVAVYARVWSGPATIRSWADTPDHLASPCKPRFLVKRLCSPVQRFMTRSTPTGSTPIQREQGLGRSPTQVFALLWDQKIYPKRNRGLRACCSVSGVDNSKDHVLLSTCPRHRILVATEQALHWYLLVSIEKRNIHRY